MSLSLARSLASHVNKLMVSSKTIELGITKKFFSQKINHNLTLPISVSKAVQLKSDFFFKRHLSTDADSSQSKEPPRKNPIKHKNVAMDEITSAVAATQSKEATKEAFEEENDENYFDAELEKLNITIVQKERSFKNEKSENHPFKIVKAIPISPTKHNVLGWQPTAETHRSLMIDGVPYEKLHIVHVITSKNNTKLCLTEYTGSVLYMCSAGTCGFKNKKRSTAVAAQAAGIAMSNVIKRRGIKNVRILVRGFGNGRLPTIKAIQLSKINIVSITDNSPIPLTFVKPNRPPVPRRV